MYRFEISDFIYFILFTYSYYFRQPEAKCAIYLNLIHYKATGIFGYLPSYILKYIWLYPTTYAFVELLWLKGDVEYSSSVFSYNESNLEILSNNIFKRWLTPFIGIALDYKFFVNIFECLIVEHLDVSNLPK